MRITFLGATGTVTGSKYLLEAAGARILVDCGLFQGFRELRDRNWASPPFDPRSLDAVVLTHAHIDHTGYLPRLVKLGFRGRAYCTTGTRDLLHVLLPDSGYLQEEAARHAAKWGYSRHVRPLPLYTRAEAEESLRCLEPVEFHEDFAPARGVTGRFTRAGHILGSACLALRADDTSIAFSGDVGRPNDPIMKAPEPMPQADFLVVESTYGDRAHPTDDLRDALATVVRETVARGGTVVVPAFAVGRAQHLLHLLSELRRADAIPEVPVYLDSPMATEATTIFCKHLDDHGISKPECHRMCKLPIYTRDPEQSKAIDAGAESAIVISASGMATGGRVLHHLRRFLPDERSAVLMVGYQPSGTRGRLLLDGASELRLFGQTVTVRARVVALPGLSAHADHVELVAWLRGSGLSPTKVFVTHGEPTASGAFRDRLVEAFGWNVEVPEDGSAHDLHR
ncbi:MAG: MBL fold metallo-hydrolase [Deltaproteobacteria bacterium]|jgi:metallo-beta-lactamase family protein|nr:MBL fold metallo-hydrolase [Deltaproteobacteria bacterium]